ncbi:MAG: DNA methyltransferase [Kiritimatiellia bacterium]|nr:DNA methyltransferase [Kiritimatiellia bacterium]
MHSRHKIIIGDSRCMDEIHDASVHLVITSPPYWQLKDYGAQNQIGYNDSYGAYIDNLNRVWKECFRVLHPGCRLCINIGDQFARAVIYGRYKVIPIRTEIIRYCESMGLDYMGAIIWQKVTTCKTTGGATVMGSYPYPRNGIIKIDYEFILVFKKLGKELKVSDDIKEQSKLTNKEWNEYFNGHWYFPGEKQNAHMAMFPVELPRRLIKMFSFIGETVLDPFLGSGTTSKAAIELGRNSIGYEINERYYDAIKEKIGAESQSLPGMTDFTLETIVRNASPGKEGSLQVAVAGCRQPERLTDPKQFRFGAVIDADSQREREETFRVKIIPQPDTLVLDSGLTVKLLGVNIPDGEMIRAKAGVYLEQLVAGQRVVLKYDWQKHDSKGRLLAYVYLTNKTFINAKLIKSGLACYDQALDYRVKQMFAKYEEEAMKSKVGMWEMKEQIVHA